MGLFNKLFGKDKVTPEPVKAEPAPKVKEPKEPKSTKKTPKDIANEKGEPWVGILSVDIDPENIGQGAFELDWNDKFLAQLVRSGYQVKVNEPENEIVDRWFQDVCRNVVLETYEQYEANNPRQTVRKDIGGGRAEIS